MSEVTPASHTGSRDGHPLADGALGLAGLTSGASQAKLDGIEAGALKRPEQNFAAALPASNWNQTLSATTWTRLNDGTANYPRVDLPVLGTPPSGTKWFVETYGFIRVQPGATGTIYIGAELDAGTMGVVRGGLYIGTASQQYMIGLSSRFDISTPAATHTIDYSIFSTSAQTVLIIRQSPLARAYLVPA